MIDSLLEEVRTRDWGGCGHELLRLLKHASPEVRSAAAVRIGELFLEPAVGLPPAEALLAELARCDAEHPGVADAFWATVVSSSISLDSILGWTHLKAWMLGVLRERSGRKELSPVPGNDLEFHAHEAFDDDPGALMSLLSWGYTDVVEWALDHRGALEREHAVALLQALYERTRRAQVGEWLATEFGVLRPEVVPSWPTLRTPEGATASFLQRDYAYRRLWTVYWLFPYPSPWRLPDDAGTLLANLIAGGLPLDPMEAELDPTQIAHIAFPSIPHTRRQTHLPRRDLELSLAVDETTQAVVALRVVRARHPLEGGGYKANNQTLA